MQHHDPHTHAHAAEDYPLEPSEAFQLLSWFLSQPSRESAEELRSYLPDIRSIAFYYRFHMDAGGLPEAQAALVRQYLAQTYAAQQLLQRYSDE